MDAIIRAAAVSSVTRELRRQPGPGAAPKAAVAAVPAVVAAVPAAASAPAARAPAPLPALPTPASVPAQVLPAVPSAVPAAVAPPNPPRVAPAPTFVPPPALAPRVDLAAEREAARLEAEIELAQLRADAERRGYAAGAEHGQAAAQQSLQAQIERFQGLSAQMVRAKASVLEDAEDGVVELAFAALCRILGEQAATREGVLAAVRQCAIASREREQVAVRLHPDDYALLGPAAQHQARFSPDPDITLGGCIVDSATGSLDARLETQLERLRATLVQVRAARRAPEESV